jgi:hypothetical protein
MARSCMFKAQPASSNAYTHLILTHSRYPRDRINAEELRSGRLQTKLYSTALQTPPDMS